MKKKIIKIMKLSGFLLLFTVLQVLAVDSYSQRTKLTLDLKNITVEDALKTIEDQSEFFFLYSPKMIDASRKVDIELADKKVDFILNQMFTGTGVSWVVKDRQIVITTDEMIQPFKKETPQQIVVTGKVTGEDGNPLPGVNITIKGTLAGTITNVDGNYSIEVDDPDATLVFSFIGYRSQEAEISGRAVINITLAVEAFGLEEVVAIGYGIQKRRSVTSSVSSVDVNDAAKIPTSSISQTLSGRAAGLSVNMNSAQPGGSVALQIRGNATGREPLIVIDGMPTSSFSPTTVGRFKTGSLDGILSTLNQNDIESIDILKDASATAIYGSKAAGGVILITTKRGIASKDEEGTFSVDLTASGGVQEYFNVPTILNDVQYMQETNRIIKERWLYNSRTDVYSNVPKRDNWTAPSAYQPYYSESKINEYINGEKAGTYWPDEVTRTGVVQNYNLSISGNQQNTRFYASFSAYDQKGIIKNNDLSKYTGSINLDQKFGKKISGGFNINFSQNTINNVSIGNGKRWEKSGIFVSALTFDPTLPVYDSDGNYQPNTRQANIPNPVSYLDITNRTKMERFFSTAYLKYDILPELSMKGQVGFDRNQSESYGYLPTTNIAGASVNGRADRAGNENANYQIQFLLNYIKTFGDKHNISSTLGTEYMKYNWEGLSITATNFPYDGVLWNNLALAATRPSISSHGGGSELVSYFLRTSYNYDYKYFITANFRIDGSANFSPTKQYAFFPGISIGWDISREPFMESDNNWLNQLKLRAGYGVTGNDDIGTAFSDWYGAGFKTMWGDQIVSGVSLVGLGNPNLTWEKQVDVNFGIDFSLFRNNRVTGTVDIFNREISRILGGRSLVSWNPIASVSYNLEARKQTYGAELSLNVKNIQTNVFSWNSGINFTYYRDRWLQRDPSYVLGINESYKQNFGELWYYKTDGLVPLNSTDPLNIIPGTIKTLDANGYLLDQDGARVVDENGQSQYSGNPDGKIDDADLQLVGVNQPFTIGFSNAFNYKQFDLSVHTYGVFNRWKENTTKTGMGGGYSYEYSTSVACNLEAHVLNRWNSDNQNGTEASSNSSLSRAGNWGDFYLEKAWFIRVRDITLGYTLPQGKLKGLRIFCNVMNPFLFTPYSGMDPETDAYIAAYPNQRTYNLGLNFSF